MPPDVVVMLKKTGDFYNEFRKKVPSIGAVIGILAVIIIGFGSWATGAAAARAEPVATRSPASATCSMRYRRPRPSGRPICKPPSSRRSTNGRAIWTPKPAGAAIGAAATIRPRSMSRRWPICRQGTRCGAGSWARSRARWRGKKAAGGTSGPTTRSTGMLNGQGT